MAPAAPPETPLARKLAERINSRGPISFADYMEACLYDPQHGYYSVDRHTQHGDYFTSVEVHPIFGRLLGRQLEEMWRVLDRPRQFVVVELGAGNGTLAQQILEFCATEFPGFYAVLNYIAVERSAARRGSLEARFAGSVHSGRISSTEVFAARMAAGCVLSNEYFDALPVHRVLLLRGQLREIFVGHQAGRFVESLRMPSEDVSRYFTRQNITLQEEQQAEACLAACQHIREVGSSLERGFVLTVDYGHDARELYNAQHMRGTLLAYSPQHSGEDYYRAPGEQDLTAHVNFTALELWGREVGLEPLGRVSQTQFLLALAKHSNFVDLHAAPGDELASLRGRLKLKTLIHPEGMGETFQVEIQHKGSAACSLAGLVPFST
jgi:SAM-dependent MidA family methyltransferase